MLGSVVGSYRVVRQIGEGGMGRVYLAEHSLIGKRAAVKVLLPQYSSNADVVNRFFNEARASSLLKHPGVIDVYDFGRLPDGSAFIVMEFLDGESLTARVRREPQQPLGFLVDIARQVATALAAAHEKRIVHRDLKPDNIFLVPDSEMRSGVRAKILDFGIAKLTDDSAGAASTATRTGAIIGTPTYMSPEQCRGAGRVDHRTDIYALGCLMFEMASGRPPFVGEGPGDVLAAHLFQEPPSLARIQPVLADIVARMLAKKPEDRFQTMNEVVSALVGAGRGGRTAQESIPTLRSAIPQEAVRTELHPNATVYKPTTTLGSANGELSTVHGAGRRGPPRLLIVSAVFFFVLSVGTSAIVWVRRNATGQKIADSKATAGDSNVDRPPTAQPEPARSPVVEAAHTPTRSSPSPQRVVLSLDSQPAGADVFRAADGIRVGKTPWKGEYEASSAEAVFLLRLKGYRDQSVVMTLSRDVTRAISMERLARRTSAAKTPTTPPTAEKKQTPASSSAPSDKKPEKNGVVDPFAN